MPRWGIEARRRLRSGEMVRGTEPPPRTGERVESEGLIWMAANHPVPFWLLTVAYPLPLIFVIALVVFLISR
jgi:hypothetical protein